MKKVFLLFGIAAFSAASAQQKDLFDIQKHLQEKLDKDKKVAKKNKISFPFSTLFISSTTDFKDNSLSSYFLPNGDKVIILSLDNMPCVQPDMQQFQIMPNVFYEGQFNYAPLKALPGQIPNGSVPFKMIVSK
jgi:hypothetical protein